MPKRLTAAALGDSGPIDACLLHHRVLVEVKIVSPGSDPRHDMTDVLIGGRRVQVPNAGLRRAAIEAEMSEPGRYHEGGIVAVNTPVPAFLSGGCVAVPAPIPLGTVRDDGCVRQIHGWQQSGEVWVAEEQVTDAVPHGWIETGRTHPFMDGVLVQMSRQQEKKNG